MKQKQKQNTTFDIMHSYIEIFKHAQKNNYQNILILEDDFIFDKEISYLKHTTKINDFCMKHKKDDFILSLGSLPFIIFPYNEFFYKAIISIGTQSMIYSRPFINKTLTNKSILIIFFKLEKILGELTSNQMIGSEKHIYFYWVLNLFAHHTFVH